MVHNKIHFDSVSHCVTREWTNRDSYCSEQTDKQNKITQLIKFSLDFASLTFAALQPSSIFSCWYAGCCARCDSKFQTPVLCLSLQPLVPWEGPSWHWLLSHPSRRAAQDALRAAFLPHSWQFSTHFGAPLHKQQLCWGNIPAGSRGCWLPWFLGAKAVLLLRVSTGSFSKQVTAQIRDRKGDEVTIMSKWNWDGCCRQKCPHYAWVPCMGTVSFSEQNV